MKKIDKILAALGLVRKKKHDSTVTAHEIFTERLALAAKTAGVPVLLNYQCIKNERFDRDIFAVGEYSLFHGNTVCGGSVIVGPLAHHSTVSNNFFTSEQKS